MRGGVFVSVWLELIEPISEFNLAFIFLRACTATNYRIVDSVTTFSFFSLVFEPNSASGSVAEVQHAIVRTCQSRQNFLLHRK